MCVIFREQDDQHLDEEQGNAVDQVLVGSAFGFAHSFDVLRLPLQHSFVSDSLGGIKERQYCGQIKDTTTP